MHVLLWQRYIAAADLVHYSPKIIVGMRTNRLVENKTEQKHSTIQKT